MTSSKNLTSVSGYATTRYRSIAIKLNVKLDWNMAKACMNPIARHKNLPNIHWCVKILKAVTGNDVSPVSKSLHAKLMTNMVRTENEADRCWTTVSKFLCRFASILLRRVVDIIRSGLAPFCPRPRRPNMVTQATKSTKALLVIEKIQMNEYKIPKVICTAGASTAVSSKASLNGVQPVSFSCICP